MARFSVSVNDVFLDEFEGKNLTATNNGWGIRLVLTNEKDESLVVAEFSSNYMWMITRENDE